ncbi:MAG: FtsK/SpoIIIE domain-containing protein, partial [Actinomycetes bacterium]
MSQHRSVLLQDLQETAFVPDLAPEEVFSAFCRQMARSKPAVDGATGSIPSACSLGDVLPLTAEATAERWNTSSLNEGLAAPLGIGATGTKTIDLQSDGPHLLVAGTTGSGKSELLRSLTLALALSHPPERLNFFFIDFKGGSGLGPLSNLVHCVGLQTDLSTSEMERTLRSLRAEIRLREQQLAAANVPDITTYRCSPAAANLPLPHLVIVIDEFRMLVDDAPEVLRELLRIASIGRSLGIHLVMATQRPQGALTADIRANVTSSIALRVQSDMESADIINSKVAAAISIDTPGRAFLARGTEAAEAFQGASLGISRQDQQPDGVTAHLATDFLARAEGQPTNASAAPTPAQVVDPLTAIVKTLCAVQAKQEPRKPVAPPLPEELEDHADDPALTAAGQGGFIFEAADTGDQTLRL